jgi:hypothetical protein
MDTVGARLTATLQKLDKAMNLTKGLLHFFPAFGKYLISIIII